MWNMAASSSSSSMPPNMGNVVVLTHVVPKAPNGQQPLSERSQRFKRGQPKALGVVQIMIGVVILTFGIATIFYQASVGVLSGIFVWGTLLYIAAGSVAVAAENSLSLCLINASLALNITAAIVAGTGVILYGIDSTIYYYYDHGRNYYPGFSITLTVFQFLEFVVAITSAGYTCNAACSCCSGGQRAMVQTTDGAFATQAPPHTQTPFFFPGHPQPQGQQVIFQTADGAFTTQAPPHIQTPSVLPAQPQPQGQQAIFQTADGAFTTQAPPHIQTPSVLPAQPQPQMGPNHNSPDTDSTLPPAYQHSF